MGNPTTNSTPPRTLTAVDMTNRMTYIGFLPPGGPLTQLDSAIRIRTSELTCQQGKYEQLVREAYRRYTPFSNTIYLASENICARHSNIRFDPATDS